MVSAPKIAIGIAVYRRSRILTVFYAAALLASFLVPPLALASSEGVFSTDHHDARGLAMAGACVCLAYADPAVHWNPARIAFAQTRSASVSYGEVIEDISSGLTTVSMAIPLGKEQEPLIPGLPRDRWAIGFFISHFGVDDIAGAAQWAETALAACVARSIIGYASVGLSIRYLNVSSDIEEGGADGASADLAVSVDTTDKTRAALVVRNVAGRLSWDSARNEKLPASADLAFSYSHSRWACGELVLHFDNDGLARAAIGLEASAADGDLIFWAGLKRYTASPARNVPSLGVGLPAGGLLVSYGAAFDDNEGLGTTQRVSVSAKF